jgi:hypothetical protein
MAVYAEELNGNENKSFEQPQFGLKYTENYKAFNVTLWYTSLKLLVNITFRAKRFNFL